MKITFGHYINISQLTFHRQFSGLAWSTIVKRKQDAHVRTLVLGEAWEEPVSGDANYDESLDPANRRLWLY